MVRFRCRRSGNYVCFSRDEDIASMRKHEGYEECPNELVAIAQEQPAAKPEEKRRGRPRKTDDGTV